MIHNTCLIITVVFCLCNSLFTLPAFAFEEGTGDSCTSRGKKGICLRQTDCANDYHSVSDTYLEQCRLHSDGTPVICCINNKSTGPNKREETETENIPHISSRFLGPNLKNSASTFEPSTETEPPNSIDNNSSSDIQTRFLGFDRNNKHNAAKYNKPPPKFYNNLDFAQKPNKFANGFTTTNNQNPNQNPKNKYDNDVKITNLYPVKDEIISSRTNNKYPTWGINQAPIWGVQKHEVPKSPPIWGDVVTSKPPPIWGTSEKYTKTTTKRSPPPYSSKRISEQKCEEYSQMVTSTISVVPLALDSQITSIKVNDCKLDAATLIVGGTKAILGEFPHMAAIGYRSGNSISYNCGGTLISDQYVITAAHCTQTSLGYPVQIRLGDLNLLNWNDGANPEEYNVAEVIVHRDYKPPQLYNDIALLRLGHKVRFTTNIRPACLYTENYFTTKKVIATGWGTTGSGELPSDDLLKVELNILNNTACGQLYGYDGKIQKGVTNTMMCATDLSGGKDTCQGDSGGPIQISQNSNKCVHYIVGITSFGKFCGEPNSPAIYTRISSYLSWIEENVWRSNR